MKEESYTTLPSGLKVYDVVVGTGSLASNGARVVVHYDCRWKRLTVSSSRVGPGVTGGTPYGFDLGTPAATPGGPFIKVSLRSFTNHTKGKGIRFYSDSFFLPLFNHTRKGLNEAIVGMRVGGQRKAIVPPELACAPRRVSEGAEASAL